MIKLLIPRVWCVVAITRLDESHCGFVCPNLDRIFDAFVCKRRLGPLSLIANARGLGVEGNQGPNPCHPFIHFVDPYCEAFGLYSYVSMNV